MKEKEDFEPNNSSSDLEPVASHSYASSNSIEQYLKTRIDELNDADISFCKKRWDKNIDVTIRAIYREHSNAVTFARQELQTVLKLLNSDKNPERSVATESDSSTEAKSQNVLKSNKLGDSSTEADKPLQNSPVKEDWISVEDRLPDVIGILAYTGGLILKLTFIEGIYYFPDGSKWCNHVTHWQPLPAPPIETNIIKVNL